MEQNKAKFLTVIQNETLLTQMLLKLISEDAKIGFEMTNHYFYNQNLLLEKLVVLNDLKAKLKK